MRPSISSSVTSARARALRQGQAYPSTQRSVGSLAASLHSLDGTQPSPRYTSSRAASLVPHGQLARCQDDAAQGTHNLPPLRVGTATSAHGNVYLFFNGVSLSIIQNNKTVFQIPAVSGVPASPFSLLPGGMLKFKKSFSYSPDKYDDENTGPIPPGEYAVNTASFRKLTAVDDLVGVFVNGIWHGAGGRKVGAFPGGGWSWGVGRYPIEGYSALRPAGGFTIHGGDEAGSAGCIDCTKYMEDLVKALNRYAPNKKIKLVVDYSNIFPAKIIR